MALRRTMLGLTVLWSLPASAQSCADALADALTVASKAYTVAFRTLPAAIEVGRHFSVELIVCRHGALAVTEAVRVDAIMPEHGHGMNYQAAVTALGDGRYRADGLLFHMPGRWDFIFDLSAAGGTERLQRSVVVQ